jgi:predicted RNase H-like nuclease (RuvC/YqgF family)
MLHRYWPKIERMRNLKSHDPELYELNVTDERLDRQCRQITMKIRADNGENEETKDELRTLITEHFGVRQRKMEHHVAKLEKRLQNLKKNLEMRRQKRSELEAQRFGELIGASDAVKF